MITFGGAEIYIGVPPASVSFGAEVGLEDFDGVTWELVDGLYNIGEINSEQMVNEFEVIGSEWMRKTKSTRNSGTMINQFVPDGLDPGQLRMASAVGNCRAYPIKVVYKGSRDGGDVFYPSGETVLFYATVSEGVISGGGKGELLLKSWQLNITTNVIRYYPTVFFGEALSFSDMAQDSAGTAPVADVEQPVGYWVNKSGNAFALKQSDPTKKPNVSSRINIIQSGPAASMEKTSNITVSDTTKAGRPAISAVNSTGSVSSYVRSVSSVPVAPPVVSLVATLKLYAGTDSKASVGISSSVQPGSVEWGGADSTVEVVSGPGTSSSVGGLFTIVGLSDTVATSVRMTRIFPTGLTSFIAVGVYLYPGVYSPAPDPGASVVFQDLDLRFSTDVNYPAYQRVSGPADYDKVGFPQFLRFDGVDDFLGSIIPAGDYTVAVGTLEGTNFNEITHPGGQLSIGPGGIISTHNRVVGVVIREGELTPLQKSDVIEHFRAVTGKGELV